VGKRYLHRQPAIESPQRESARMERIYPEGGWAVFEGYILCEGNARNFSKKSTSVRRQKGGEKDARGEEEKLKSTQGRNGELGDRNDAAGSSLFPGNLS